MNSRNPDSGDNGNSVTAGPSSSPYGTRSRSQDLDGTKKCNPEEFKFKIPEPVKAKKCPKFSFDPYQTSLPWTKLSSSHKAKGRCSEDTWEVEKILQMRVGKRGQLTYLVKWKSWSPLYNNWEAVKNLKGCKKLIAEFHESLGVTPEQIRQLGKRKIRMPRLLANKTKRLSQNITKGPVQNITEGPVQNITEGPVQNITEGPVQNASEGFQNATEGPSQNGANILEDKDVQNIEDSTAKSIDEPIPDSSESEEEDELLTVPKNLEELCELVKMEKFAKIKAKVKPPTFIYEYIYHEGIKAVRVKWENELVDLVKYDEAKKLWPAEVKKFYASSSRQNFELDY